MNTLISPRVMICLLDDSSSYAVSNMPEEQKAHCAALRAINSSCNSANWPLSVRPSIVSIRLPDTWTVSVRQPRAVRPSISTVQAPQTPCSQPRWVPGELVEFHEAPEVYCTNICFGGADMRKAFITLSGTGRLIAVDWPRAGLPLHDPLTARGGKP